MLSQKVETLKDITVKYNGLTDQIVSAKPDASCETQSSSTLSISNPMSSSSDRSPTSANAGSDCTSDSACKDSKIPRFRSFSKPAAAKEISQGTGFRRAASAIATVPPSVSRNSSNDELELHQTQVYSKPVLRTSSLNTAVMRKSVVPYSFPFAEKQQIQKFMPISVENWKNKKSIGFSKPEQPLFEKKSSGALCVAKLNICDSGLQSSKSDKETLSDTISSPETKCKTSLENPIPQNTNSKSFNSCRRTRIMVCVRKRPKNRQEMQHNDVDILAVPTKDHIVICEPRQRFDLTEYVENTTFRFDRCFDETITTAEVYRHTAAPMIDCIFQGYMATCFAYGQTGSGKTFTMAGPKSQTNHLPIVEKGIYGMVVSDLFDTYKEGNHAENLTISVNFFEIYCNKVYDLLNQKRPLRVMEDSYGSVQLLGLREYLVEDVNTTLALLKHGYLLRTNGKTLTNEHSSRSHAIFQINIRLRGLEDQRRGSEQTSIHSEQNKSPSYYHNTSNPCSYSSPRYSGPLVGRFSLVDLAGNERSADGAATRDRVRQMESGEINKSLLALKECIRAMGNNSSSYLPFRTSKLTQVLRESFIGQRSRTCMIATVSPGLSCYEHSMNTLRYAQRVKHLVPSVLFEKRNYGSIFTENQPLAEKERGDLSRAHTTASSRPRTKQSSNGRRSKCQAIQPLEKKRYKASVSPLDKIASEFDILTNNKLPRSQSGETYALNKHIDSFVCPTEDELQQVCASHENLTISINSEGEYDQIISNPTITKCDLGNQFEKSSSKRGRSTQTQYYGSNTSSKHIYPRNKTASPRISKRSTNKKGCIWRVQQQKHDVIQKHREFVKNLPRWISEHQRLLDRAYQDNANMLAYVDLLTNRLSKDINQLKTIHDDALVLRCLQTN